MYHYDSHGVMYTAIVGIPTKLKFSLFGLHQLLRETTDAKCFTLFIRYFLTVAFWCGIDLQCSFSAPSPKRNLKSENDASGERELGWTP